MGDKNGLKNKNRFKSKMLIYVDIDETICSYKDKQDKNYENAIPNAERIQKINKLYEKGHTIVYWTARGTLTGKQWFTLTLTQLQQWNAKFHELRMGKPAFDMFIDDKAFNSEDFFKKK